MTTTERPWVVAVVGGGVAGLVAGLALVLAVMTWSGAPRGVPEDTIAEAARVMEAMPAAVPVRMGWTVETRCEATIPEAWGAAGRPWARRRVRFGVVHIDHPRGRVQFGAGPACAPSSTGSCACVLPQRLRARVEGSSTGSPSRPSTTSTSSTPATDVDARPEDAAAAPRRLVVLPSLRPWHVGGTPNLAAGTRVLVSSTSLGAAEGGPVAWREPMAMPTVAEGVTIEDLAWRPGDVPGRGRVVDLFGDGAVLALAWGGSTWEEVALLVRAADTPPTLFVGDAIWWADQLDTLHARGLWSAWLHDRNRIGLRRTITSLRALREVGVRIVPLLDPDVVPSDAVPLDAVPSDTMPVRPR